jgi:polyisoprenoid-binding protein YceI
MGAMADGDELMVRILARGGSMVDSAIIFRLDGCVVNRSPPVSRRRTTGGISEHMAIATVRGRFLTFEGSVTYDEADPSRSSATATMQAASIDTDWDQRDGHLRSGDFLDVERFPTVTFRSTSVEPTGARTARVHGDLTIRDVTRPVVLEAELVGMVKGMQGERRAAFEARTKIDREAWGLTWNVALEAGNVLVGNELKIEIEIEATEAAA